MGAPVKRPLASTSALQSSPACAGPLARAEMRKTTDALAPGAPGVCRCLLPDPRRARLTILSPWLPAFPGGKTGPSERGDPSALDGVPRLG
jgi:hypothetical protein